MSIEIEYSKLEETHKLYMAMQADYFRMKYFYMRSLNAIKKLSPLKIDFKNYSAKARRDCKKRQKAGFYGKRPRGMELDHSRPLLYLYCIGEENLDVINSKDNCKWIPKKVNKLKGIIRDQG